MVSHWLRKQLLGGSSQFGFVVYNHGCARFLIVTTEFINPKKLFVRVPSGESRVIADWSRLGDNHPRSGVFWCQKKREHTQPTKQAMYGLCIYIYILYNMGNLMFYVYIIYIY